MRKSGPLVVFKFSKRRIFSFPVFTINASPDTAGALATKLARRLIFGLSVGIFSSFFIGISGSDDVVGTMSAFEKIIPLLDEVIVIIGISSCNFILFHKGEVSHHATPKIKMITLPNNSFLFI